MPRNHWLLAATILLILGLSPSTTLLGQNGQPNRLQRQQQMKQRMERRQKLLEERQKQLAKDDEKRQVLAIGDEAPDFTLKSPDGTKETQLSTLYPEKPVVLIFGSYT
ncbi:MAG: hypothetical protein R3C03_19665 [Pirellulaceae bacterium]